MILLKSFWRKRPLVDIRTEQETLLKKWTIVFFFAFIVTGIKLNWSVLVLGDIGLLSDNFIIWLSWLIVFIMILTSPSILNAYISQLSREGDRATKPISFWRLKPISTITNPKDIQLSKRINGELDVYFLQITQIVEEKHLFRKSDMTVNELALKSKIPVSHLSFIFKYHSDISFTDYRKMARIQDAVALIEEGFLKTNTLDALSEKVGFNTYNSFYIGFKEFTGKAPQSYVISLGEWLQSVSDALANLLFHQLWICCPMKFTSPLSICLLWLRVPQPPMWKLGLLSLKLRSSKSEEVVLKS